MAIAISAIRKFTADQAREYISRTGGWSDYRKMTTDRRVAHNRYTHLMKQAREEKARQRREARFGNRKPSAMAPASQAVTETEDKVTLDLIEPATASAIICESLPYNLGNAVATITRPGASNLDLKEAADYINREILRRTANSLK